MHSTADSTAAPDLSTLVQRDRVSRRLYTDQAIFDAEMQRIFGRAWLYLAHESQVPNDGDYVTAWMGTQPVIVIRHKGGIHVLHNRCPHRGVMVITDERGNTGNTLRCGYHGWTFRTNGELLLAPMRDAYAGRYDMQDHAAFGLARVPRVGSYRGFIFASLAPLDDPLPDLVPFLGQATHCIDHVVDRAPAGEVDVSGGVHKYLVRGNWKAQVENLNDNYHPPFSHACTTNDSQRQFRRRYGDDTGVHLDTSEQNSKWDSVLAQGLDWGLSYCGPLPFNHENRGGPLYEAHRAALRARHSEEEVDRIMTDFFHNVIIYPSVVMQLASSHVRTIRPIAPDRTEIRVYPIKLKGAPDEINRQLIRYLNITHSAASLIQSDDVEMFRRVQAGLASEGQEWVWFNRHMQDDESLRGGGTSEVIMRNQYRSGYLRYMGGE
ncbi:MAG: Rieske 2Fe-2S domain-containing protein [Pigmentiphaga sp.]|uniref:aromatic ring-hydroxylating oxygenase subunit alpha n=1 Tax=Pigmentiphaga sp. TaxID=1977564 RepID=UPI0029ADA4FD|nr:Rieske 2Fe-2S domain-containing protein [Pigmentiphaga sp.]MDX3905444.1 Rieske 2Fe-2S domain-containing protein [Pigmentiphaga sp.]